MFVTVRGRGVVLGSDSTFGVGTIVKGHSLAVVLGLLVRTRAEQGLTHVFDQVDHFLRNFGQFWLDVFVESRMVKSHQLTMIEHFVSCVAASLLRQQLAKGSAVQLPDWIFVLLCLQPAIALAALALAGLAAEIRIAHGNDSFVAVVIHALYLIKGKGSRRTGNRLANCGVRRDEGTIISFSERELPRVLADEAEFPRPLSFAGDRDGLLAGAEDRRLCVARHTACVANRLRARGAVPEKAECQAEQQWLVPGKLHGL
mmetsp:Transcript_37962/g.83241  ORF Transcript_37962/g.83241 Transcript_37962/m.83241 type:complete len:258 (+) Transcript_37962:1605-2378(+)